MILGTRPPSPSDFDRRYGMGAERVVCKANDVVLTYDTGNGSQDFHIIERRAFGGWGDDFSRCCMMWPGIDRGGVYKDRIDQMTYD